MRIYMHEHMAAYVDLAFVGVARIVHRHEPMGGPHAGSAPRVARQHRRDAHSERAIMLVGFPRCLAPGVDCARREVAAEGVSSFRR